MPECPLHSEHASVIAIDQHARSATVCAVGLTTGETRSKKMTGCPTPLQMAEWASWTTELRRFVYESGPCGFQFVRDLKALGTIST